MASDPKCQVHACGGLSRDYAIYSCTIPQIKTISVNEFVNLSKFGGDLIILNCGKKVPDMAFQHSIISTSEDSPAYVHYLLSFGGIVDSPRPCIDNQAAEPAPPLRMSPRSDLLLAGEIVPSPVSECCPPAQAYFRGASLRGDVGSSVLPSSSDYDSSHPSLDAHSAPLKADFMESESFVLGEFGFVSISYQWFGHHGNAFVVARTAC